MQKAFLDTSIIISYMLGPDGSTFDKVKQLFSKAKKEKWELFVSHFCILEGLCAIRRQVTHIKTKGFADVGYLPEKLRRSIKDEVMKASTEYVDRITQKIDQGSLYLVSCNELKLEEILTEAFRVLKENFGDIRTYEEHRGLKGNKKRFYTKYKGLSDMDALHITIARETNCDHFYTTDADFEPLRHDIRFNSIEIITFT
jgi:predicted nucleic acid-binding protein